MYTEIIPPWKRHAVTLVNQKAAGTCYCQRYLTHMHSQLICDK